MWRNNERHALLFIGVFAAREPERVLLPLFISSRVVRFLTFDNIVADTVKSAGLFSARARVSAYRLDGDRLLREPNYGELKIVACVFPSLGNDQFQLCAFR